MNQNYKMIIFIKIRSNIVKKIHSSDKTFFCKYFTYTAL